MPRGFAEIYSKQTNIEMFFDIENMLSAKDFRVEHPSTNNVQVWNEEGDMIEFSRKELLPHITNGNLLITFWNDSGDSISISFDEDVLRMSKSVMLLDGFDDKEAESLFDLIKSFVLSKYNDKLIGFIFDRREISENIDWSECLQDRKHIMDAIENELKLISQKNITMVSSICIDVNNAYLAIKKTEETYDLYEFKQNS